MKKPRDVAQCPILPLEILEQIIDHCSSDQDTLRVLAGVCQVFKYQSRRLLSVIAVWDVKRHRAYSLVKIIRSPYCSITSFEHLRVQEEWF
jgi:hypothetical protein